MFNKLLKNVAKNNIFKDLIAQEIDNNTNVFVNNNINNNENNIQEFRTEKKVDNLVCNCCNNKEIKIETTIYKHGEYNLTKPIVNYEGGFVQDGVVICDECFNNAKTEVEKQALWIKGKINTLHSEINKKHEEINLNNDKIKELQNEISKIEYKNNEINKQIAQMQYLISVYENEYSKRVEGK